MTRIGGSQVGIKTATACQTLQMKVTPPGLLRTDAGRKNDLSEKTEREERLAL